MNHWQAVDRDEWTADTSIYCLLPRKPCDGMKETGRARRYLSNLEQGSA